MSFTFGPLTDVLGQTTTIVSDGNGGFVLSCPKYPSLAVSNTQFQDPEVRKHFDRVARNEDLYTNWRCLSEALGLGDPDGS